MWNHLILLGSIFSLFSLFSLFDEMKLVIVNKFSDMSDLIMEHINYYKHWYVSCVNLLINLGMYRQYKLSIDS